MSVAKRLLEWTRRRQRRYHRLSADELAAEEIRAELRRHPPLTVVGRIRNDRTLSMGVRLDTSMCIQEQSDE